MHKSRVHCTCTVAGLQPFVYISVYAACVFLSTDLPTHVLVRFNVDDCLSVVPIKNVVKQPDMPLKQGISCTVKWSSGELFACTVIGTGKLWLIFNLCYNVHCVCAGNKKAMEVAEANEIKRLEKPVENNSGVTVAVKTKKKGKRKRTESDKVRFDYSDKIQFMSCVSTAGKTCEEEERI